MTPRPRSISDDQILKATVRAIGRVGPNRLRLADIAGEIGISPATLSQRFGSKRGLLLAVAGRGGEALDDLFDAARSAHESPLDALLECCTMATRYFSTPEELSNHLAFLQMDLTDPEFHRLAVRQSGGIRGGLQRLLDEAVRAGELVECDTAALARAVQATYNGSLLQWAIHRHGEVYEWVRADLETVLRQFRRHP